MTAERARQELTDAAWAAYRARQRHGEASRAYKDAIADMEQKRRMLDTVTGGPK